MLLDGLSVKWAVTRDVGHDIGAVQRVAGRLQRCFFHTWTGEHGGLDLAQLYAEAANLDQTVATACEQQVAPGITAHKVARAERPFIAFFMSGVEGIFDKDIGSQFGMVQVASAQLRTADPQFAGLAVGNLLVVLADNIQAVCAGGLTDGHVCLVALHGVTRYHAATLRRTVDVQERQARRRCHGFQFLAADREEAQRRTVIERHELASRHGAHDDVRDGIVVDEL